MADWPADGTTNWNTVMKAFLDIGHDSDGTHKATEVTPVVTGEGIFGSWTDKDSGGVNVLAKGEVYKVGSDGYVCAKMLTSNNATMVGFTDGNNPPTSEKLSVQCGTSNVARSITLPVRKNDYWKVSNADTIAWLPIGSGTCVKQ